MTTQHDVEQKVPHSSSLPSRSMSRRQFLHSLAAASVATAGGSALLTACSGSSTTTTDTSPVTLTMRADWPFTAVPGNYDKKKALTPRDEGVLHSLEDWLKKYPNVKFKVSQVDVGDTNKLTAALAAKTAPDWYYGLDTFHLRSSIETGYAANTTDIVKQYNVDSLLADYALPLWKQNGNVNGVYFGLPLDAVGAGAGVYYRLDLLREKGLPEPTLDWTWNDFRTIATKLRTPGKYAMGAPSWMSGWVFNSNMLDINGMTAGAGGGILGSVPTPNETWHWRVKFDPWLDQWKDIMSLYRKMRFEDKLILQDKAAYPWEGPAMAQFAASSFPMSPGYGFHMTLDLGAGQPSIRNMSAALKKPIEQLVSFLPYPKGSNGATNPGCAPHFDVLVLNPRLKGNALDKAANLWLYMYYGEGYVNARAYAYNKSKNAADVYDFMAPGNKYQKNPKVPADVTIEAVYGKRLVQDYMNYIHQPVFPDAGFYFPVDTVSPPISAPHDDMLEKLSSQGPDIVQSLMTYQNTANQEMTKLKSDLSTSQFKSGAQAYFKALDSFFQKNQPAFYNGDWQKYYQNEVLPAIS